MSFYNDWVFITKYLITFNSMRTAGLNDWETLHTNLGEVTCGVRLTIDQIFCLWLIMCIALPWEWWLGTKDIQRQKAKKSSLFKFYFFKIHSIALSTFYYYKQIVSMNSDCGMTIIFYLSMSQCQGHFSENCVIWEILLWACLENSVHNTILTI